MVDERGAGTITDEGVDRLRRRIGVPEPHPQPPHYTGPTTDAFRHVAEAYGDDNPLWCDPAYGAKTRWGGPIAPPVARRRRHPDRRGRGHRGARPSTRDLMKGDPLRGVHAFYSASAREWWAPLRPGDRVRRRNALVGVLDKPSEFAERAVHEWTGQVFRADDGPLLSAQYRLMIRTERTKARERKKYDDVELGALHRRADRRDRGPVRRRAGRGAPSPAGGRTSPRATSVGPMVKGPLTVTDMVCWHVGMGMGLYGVKALRLAAANRPAHPPLLPPRRR